MINVTHDDGPKDRGWFNGLKFKGLKVLQTGKYITISKNL